VFCLRGSLIPDVSVSMATVTTSIATAVQ
jgi:hypothetical protein